MEPCQDGHKSWDRRHFLGAEKRPVNGFHYVALSKRSSDSLMDQGKTACVERPFAAGHPQNTVGLGNERGRNNKRFILVISFDAW